MGRLRKALAAQRENGRKGGRGRRKAEVIDSPIKTPWRPKTTVWRHRSKAAVAEQALYAAALTRFEQSTSSRPSTAGHMSFNSTRPSTGYDSILGAAGSVLSPIGISRVSLFDSDIPHETPDAPTLQLRTEQEQQHTGNSSSSNSDGSDDEFEDVDDIENIPNPHLPRVSNEDDGQFIDAVKHWPRVNSWELKKRILLKGISDMEKLLKSKRSPAGQDHQWHLQVLYFMNWQLVGVNQKLKPTVHKVKTKFTRKDCALNVAIGYRQGQRVQERILKNEKMWIQKRKIPVSLQGKNAKMMCMLEDEGTMMAVQKCIAEAGSDLRAELLAEAVTKYWQEFHPNANRQQELVTLSQSFQEIERNSSAPIGQTRKYSLSARTAIVWLNRMGYNWREVKKGIYKDGHEKADVVEYRQGVFLKRLEELKPRMPYPVRNEEGEVIDIKLPVLPPGERHCIPITHDECTCNANDGPHHQWIKGNENPIRKKSRGQGLHISEFITPWGRLQAGPEISDSQLLEFGLNKREVTEIIQCGGDIWWDNENIAQQALTAVNVFEAAHPGCQGLFLFDNATSHSAFAKDALRASKMNKGWGGEQPHLRDGWFFRNGRKITQKMSYGRYGRIPKQLRSQTKGLEAVLKERGLWPKQGLYLDCTLRTTVPSTQRKHTGNECCARRLMSQQPDFLAQKGRVQEVIEARGHLVLFYPRFHCELNWIEYFWARVKQYTRKHCKYNIKSLRENVPVALNWASDLIPKWWGKAWRIMDAYREGHIYGTEEFRTRAYKSHRRVTVRYTTTV